MVWQPKPGDKVYRPKREKKYRLRRVLGISSLFSVGYGDVGSSIYYALGIVALVAAGATPVALGIAGILFVATALTYAEGTSMFPEAGGSAGFARHAFNDTVGFISGWALMLSYIVTISISAYTIPPYLGYFWPALKDSPLHGTLFSMGIVVFLALLNIVGIKESSRVSLTAAVVDIIIQISILLLGLFFIFNISLVWQRITLYWPSPGNFIFGIAMAGVAYTGVESMSQMAEETKKPQVRVPRALILMIVVVLVLFSGISLTAFSAMTPAELAQDWARDPVAGIASAISSSIDPKAISERWSVDPTTELVIARLIEWFKGLLQPAVSILAATILLIASNAGLMGSSRLSFSLGSNKPLPPVLSRTSIFRTPYVAISLFSLIAMALLVPGIKFPGLFENMGAIYTFASLLAFFIAHFSIIMLRIRQPDAHRPFKLGLNIKILGRELPVSTLIGGIGALTVWLVLIVVQPVGRYVGLSWMAIGLAVYFLYRRFGSN